MGNTLFFVMDSVGCTAWTIDVFPDHIVEAIRQSLVLILTWRASSL